LFVKKEINGKKKKEKRQRQRYGISIDWNPIMKLLELRLAFGMRIHK
jgi:hypothetical protein